MCDRIRTSQGFVGWLGAFGNMGYLIAGFGKFGRLALARLEKAFPDARVDVLESDAGKIAESSSGNILYHRADAVSFLAESPGLRDEQIIVPMVPFHLAAGYLLKKNPRCCRTAFPSDLASKVPNPFPLDSGDLCCSRADFICPDDCPEGHLCTVTGEPREPLYELLERTAAPEFTVLVQRSFQILPGVGGYALGDLRRLHQRVGAGKYLVATSCKCHAVITAIDAGR